MGLTKEVFLKRHGEIAIATEADSHFARLRQPHFEDGKWETIDRRGKKILGGRFYNIGYFRDGEDPAAMDHDWEALDHAVTLANELASTLNAARCFSLQSEGDAPYFPFVGPRCVSSRSPDFERMGAELPEDLQRAYEAGDIRSNYDPFIDCFDYSRQKCAFWSDKLDADYAFDLSPAAYEAYLRVSDRMRAELEVPWKITFYPDFIHFPVLYGGVDMYNNLVGVITSCVWT